MAVVHNATKIETGAESLGGVDRDNAEAGMRSHGAVEVDITEALKIAKARSGKSIPTRVYILFRRYISTDTSCTI